MQLTNYKIILGITGGIAAYKSAYLTRLLVKAGAEVRVVMTEAAVKFITPLTFESLTNREVAVEMFPEGRFVSARHIALAEWPDLIVVAPATADFIAQVANGLCSSLLSAVLCATKRKVIMAPAMNEGMYANPAVRRNISTLREFGYCLAEVGVGDMACGGFGPGRMAEPEEIFELVTKEIRSEGSLTGEKILVTAGPCREAIDPVRFISNRSSGKMGFAIASEAEKLGGEVTLITGPVSLPDPRGVRVVRVETTGQMADVVQEEFGFADYLIMAAAPADYKPKSVSSQKIKKTDGETSITLKPAVDILKTVSSVRKESQVIVGFSLETENEVENSKKKLHDKKLDFIVVNNPTEEGAGFDCDTNRVVIISKSGETVELDKNKKEAIAKKIWGYILSHGRK